MLSKYLYKHDDSQTNYDAIKYSGFTAIIAIVHFIFMTLFFVMGVYPMSVYNVAAVILYIVIFKNLSNMKNYCTIYIAYVIEVVLHSVLATILVGWDFGFMFYLIAFLPASFYITFSLESFKRNLVYPYLTFAVVLGAFLIVKGITLAIPPFYTEFGNGFRIFLYYLNAIMGFVTTFLFSAMFAIDVSSMQMKMESDQQNLEEQANFDPLTHFLNRRSMNERLNHAHRNAIINEMPYSLIMTDIDNFKKFNDTYGHDCGDYVLQSIAKIMTAQIRAKDSACRWGGEEFLLLITENMDTAYEVAERIRKAVDEYEFYYEGQTLHVTLTLGVSSYYASSKVKTLIEIADKRLYKGKSNGKNQVVKTS